MSEAFLFHLHRGAELLQSDRVHDAKAELERALGEQPRDPKGQDLLGVVYFRLGLYPRAISIYEDLVQGYPEAVTPRVNLALCYLKTAQALRAKEVLERLLEIDPHHTRAWGYLGLAYQRLGDYERAGQAFAQGGHDVLARKSLEASTATASPSLRPGALPGDHTETVLSIRGAGLGGPLSVDGLRRLPSLGLDPAREPLPPLDPLPALRVAPTQSPGPLTEVTAAPPPPDAHELGAGFSSPPSSQPLSSAGVLRVQPPLQPLQLVRESLLVFPRDMAVSTHVSGLVLVQVKGSFAARLDHVRSLAFNADVTGEPLMRKQRKQVFDEPVGGAAAPLRTFSGHGELVLGPAKGRRLLALSLEEDPLYLREEILVGFETTLNYESGRLALGDGDVAHLIQLRGRGEVVVAFPAEQIALEVTPERALIIRGSALLGWIGRIVPRALLPSEAPAGAHGFVSLVGEGMVLTHGE